MESSDASFDPEDVIHDHIIPEFHSDCGSFVRVRILDLEQLRGFPSSPKRSVFRIFVHVP